MGWCRQWLILIMVLVTTTVGQAEARSLHWRELDVTARLDADGRLHVRERQVMVFSGDWNGGERRFRVPPGQRLELHRIARFDPATGVEIPLQQGRLTAIDRWDWQGRDTVRWRSRLPADPVFRETELVYLLDYTLSGLLLRQGDHFLLDHDFAFPDRPGPISRFHLTLTLDPAWQAPDTLVRELVRPNLTPGQGVVLAAPLIHTGDGPVSFREPPGAARRPVSPPPPWLKPLVLAGFWLLLFARGLSWYRHEQRLGRFLSVDGPVDRAWLDRHVFSLPPEVVGAAWDRSTGAAEVAAVIARLVQEGKLVSRVEQPGFRLFGRTFRSPAGPVLHLTLRSEREAFKGYERQLINGLFIDGDTTDTRRVRAYYRRKEKSFDPVDKLRWPLADRVGRLTGDAVRPLTWSWMPVAVLFAAGLLLLAWEGLAGLPDLAPALRRAALLLSLGLVVLLLLAIPFHRRSGSGRTLLPLLTGLFGFWSIGFVLVATLRYGLDLRPLLVPVAAVIACGFVAAIPAHSYRLRADLLRLRGAVLAVVVLLLAGVLSWLLARTADGPLRLTGYAGLLMAWGMAVFSQARCAESPEGVALRLRLAAGRAWCRAQLERDRPDLDDRWFPYLLAFGLGPQVDHWFRAYGEAAAAGDGFSGQAGSSGGFSAGGGSFGGAGAAGAWGAAASGFAAAGSSASSGSSGGGGGSSGGGGGGGW